MKLNGTWKALDVEFGFGLPLHRHGHGADMGKALGQQSPKPLDVDLEVGLLTFIEGLHHALVVLRDLKEGVGGGGVLLASCQDRLSIRALVHFRRWPASSPWGT